MDYQKELSRLNKEKENLSTIIECIKYFESCESFIDQYKGDVLEDIAQENIKSNGMIAWGKTTAYWIEKEYNKYISLLDKCKTIKEGFDIVTARDKKEQYLAQYNDVLNKIKDLYLKIYQLDVDQIPFNEGNELPEKVLIGLKDKQPIELDLLRNGAVFITHHLYDFDEQLMMFISAFIIKLYKSFPLNSVKVMLVDPERKFRKTSSFINALSMSKDSFEYFQNYESVLQRLDEECRLLTPKFNYLHPDFYSIYKTDTSNKIKFVICLSGLRKSLSGYGNGESLVYEMFNKTSDFYRSGIRCIAFYDDIRDNNDYNQKDIVGKINRIKNYCDYCLVYEKARFKYSEDFIKTLYFKDSFLDRYIENTCSEYAKRANGKHSANFSYEEIGFGQIRGSATEPFISIPVGRSGDKTVDMTFYCGGRGEGEDYKNRIIGYLITGTTGSGKSSLLHSLVVEGSMKYSPDELEFWIVDLKENAMASRYINSNIPQVSRVAKQSTPEDLYMMLTELNDIRAERNRIFAEYAAPKSITIDSVYRYNDEVLKDNDGKHKTMPRIVMVIDEIQVAFNKKVDSELRSGILNQVADLANLGRATGVHLVIVSQAGEEDDLEQFAKQGGGQILFNQPVKKGFYREIVNDNADSISRLDRGHFVMCLSEDVLFEARSVFVNFDANPNALRYYFDQIINKYPSNKPQLQIGDATQLLFNKKSIIHKNSYWDIVCNNKSTNSFVVGEHYITLQNEAMSFKQDRNQAGFIVGGQNSVVSQSILTSLFLQVVRQNHRVYAFDFERQKNCPYSFLLPQCERINVSKQRLEEACIDLYREYLERESIKQENEDFDEEFEPIYVFINGLDEISVQKKNTKLSFDDDSQQEELVEEPPIEIDENDVLGSFTKMVNSFNPNPVSLSKPSSSKISIGAIEADVEDVLTTLFENGSKVSIFMISTLFKPNCLRNLDEFIENSSNTVLFNQVDFGYFQFSDNGLAKETLNDIAGKNNNESMAFSRINLKGHKFRPIIYKEEEFKLLLDAMNGGC